MSDARDSASALPPLCYIRHPETGETVVIIRGEPGWRPAHTKCSPDCLKRQTRTSANTGTDPRHEARLADRLGHTRREPRSVAAPRGGGRPVNNDLHSCLASRTAAKRPLETGHRAAGANERRTRIARTASGVVPVSRILAV